MASIALKQDVAGKAAGALAGWRRWRARARLPRHGGARFRHDGGDHATPDRSGFLSAFFVLVGMHGLHVTIGSIWMMVMLVPAGGTFGRDRQGEGQPHPPQPVLALPGRDLDRDLLGRLPARADPMTSPHAATTGDDELPSPATRLALLLTFAAFGLVYLRPARRAAGFLRRARPGLGADAGAFPLLPAHRPEALRPRRICMLILFSSLIIALMVGGTLGRADESDAIG